MKKILAVLVAATAALGLSVAVPEIASAGSSGWPTTTAPLLSGSIVSQSSSKAVVLSPRTVLVTRQSLDAAYVAKGWTLGSSSGIPRWYRKSGKEVDVFYAALDGGQSYWTLTAK